MRSLHADLAGVVISSVLHEVSVVVIVFAVVPGDVCRAVGERP